MLIDNLLSRTTELRLSYNLLRCCELYQPTPLSYYEKYIAYHMGAD